MSCEHEWEFWFSTGEDAPGHSKDIVETCNRCGATKHDYRHGGGQRSPNYPMFRRLDERSHAQRIFDVANARLRDVSLDANVRHDLYEISRLASLLLWKPQP